MADDRGADLNCHFMTVAVVRQSAETVAPAGILHRGRRLVARDQGPVVTKAASRQHNGARLDMFALCLDADDTASVGQQTLYANPTVEFRTAGRSNTI